MAVHRSIGGRDPLAYPKLENDDNFIGRREIRVRKLFTIIIFLEKLEKFPSLIE